MIQMCMLCVHMKVCNDLGVLVVHINVCNDLSVHVVHNYNRHAVI